ncbi:DUF5357 family protein [Argonema galeatum]|uniref:DUF5357 family protein n=1 Tax=Argonema galeatum TaxID=2942762 RepID=UPI0020122B72|nr:DUF5357 family protein [Argonema galeatum]MCL1468336.1 DUF5357 domain-containing protein [Argonema galeatum A003/A1]
MKKIINFLTFFIKIVKPTQLFSWKTGILISFLIWVIALFAVAELQNILAFLSWLFLIISTVWFAVENPLMVSGISISSWLPGGLICIFMFGTLSNQIPSIALVSWPTASGAIAVLRELVQPGAKFKIPPPRVCKKLIILFLSHVLISCWLQFNFFIQNWLQRYPSLLADDFSQSTFVVKIEVLSKANSRGAVILNSMESLLKTQFDEKPWSEVEKWRINASKNIQILGEQAKKQLPSVEENAMWKFGEVFLPSNSGYNVELLVKWQGLGSMPDGYHLKKSCKIVPVSRPTPTRPERLRTTFSQQRKDIRSTKSRFIRRVGSPARVPSTPPELAAPSPVTLSEVKCGPVSDRINGQPKTAKP